MLAVNALQQSHYNKCTVQVQCNIPSQQGPSAGHASTAYAAAKFETQSYFEKALCKCSATRFGTQSFYTSVLPSVLPSVMLPSLSHLAFALLATTAFLKMETLWTSKDFMPALLSSMIIFDSSLAFF